MPTVQWRRAAVKTRGYKGLAYARAAAGVSVGGTLQNRERDAASSGGRARHLATHSLDGALAAPCPRWEATPPAAQIPQGNREGAANNRGSEHVIHISLSSELARAADILPEHEPTYFRGAMGSDPPARRSAFHAETISAARSTRLGRLSERRLPHASHAMRMQRKSCDVPGVDPRDNRTKYGTRAPLHTVKTYFMTVQVHLV